MEGGISSRSIDRVTWMFDEMNNRYVVIMAGGRGERFWPQSRLKKPKHLLPIVGEAPMLAQTVDRLKGLVPPEKVFVITNIEQREAVLESCPELLPERVIGEPQGRDTAAAVGLAALLVNRVEPGAAFALLPADHVIMDSAGFCKVLAAAFEAAESRDVLVTIGIKPDFPATGYGYLKMGVKVEGTTSLPLHQVESFVEKPDLRNAENYLHEGGYFWNAGMFIWRAEVILHAIGQYAPALSQGLDQLSAAWEDSGSVEQAMQKVYPVLEKISIDFAVMEKAQDVVMVESAFDWDDVGEWPAIARHYPADAQGNVFKGSGSALDASGNLTYAESGHTISLLGVKDLIVVQSADATLVCHKDYAQQVKNLAQQVCQKNPDLA